eukprot:7857570-Alexandrium_andersonii.AAC.1
MCSPALAPATGRGPIQLSPPLARSGAKRKAGEAPPGPGGERGGDCVALAGGRGASAGCLQVGVR